MNSIRKNFIYNALFQVVNILVPLITTPYLARILKAEGLGIYSFAYSEAYYFVTIAMLGLYNYGNRSIARCRDNKQEREKTFCEIYSMQVMTSLLLVFAYFVFILFFSNDRMLWMLIPYVVSPLFDVNWYYFGVEKFKLTAVRNISIKIISTVLILVVVRTQEDLYKYGLIMGLSFLFTQISLWPILIKEIKFEKPNIYNVIKHIKPNLVLFIPVIAITLYKMMDKIMLGIMINKEQVGFYESSEKIIQIPLALITALGTVMLPRMSNLVANNNVQKSIIYLKRSFVVAAVISTSTCFGIMGVSKEFVPLFYGPGYDACVTLFLILMPSCIVMAFANVIRTQYLVPQQLDKIYIISVSLGAVVNIVINALLIPYFESAGAAIGTFCAEFFVAAYQMFAINKRVPVFRYALYTTPFIIAGACMFIVIFNISFLNSDIGNLVIKVIIGVALYILVVLVELLVLKNKYISFMGIEIKPSMKKH